MFQPKWCSSSPTFGIVEPVDDLRVRLRRRVDVDDREVVGLVDAGVRVGAGDEEELLARALHRLLRARRNPGVSGLPGQVGPAVAASGGGRRAGTRGGP